ncbi:methionyl-tRNA formyltransferase [Gracilimonas sediminicola]|uniref:Methionyl-tRNA formyltransferase n=1 Tax=Gracilimonas sediminicola TaxID=2952158 RepID=A0A9X2REW1_9BACT|nr:methionyl-tRNA formyltransferase [Gracilimonas sediminicola]MCP9292286.1 methionyl-tRNA formyltransferase [Gracilimonas sediminicola]
MRVLFVSFHREGVETLNFLKKNDRVELAGCLSLADSSSMNKSGTYNYKTLCEELSVKYFECNHINDQETKALIKKLEPDILMVLGWGQILDQETLDIPTIGVIGAHASLLPKYRGSAPINWALINGLDETGNTLMWLDSGVDSGKIIDQKSFEINQYDSCETLYLKVAKSNKEMVESNLADILKNGRIGKAQKHDDSDLLPRRRPEDGKVNFNTNSQVLYDFIRALTKPYPGAYFVFNNQKFIVWKASFSPNTDLKAIMEKKFRVGDIIEHIYSFAEELCGIRVKLEDGSIVFHEVELEGEIFKGESLHKKFPKGVNING